MDIEALKAELRRAQEESARLRVENTRLRRDNARLRGRTHPSAMRANAAEQLSLGDPASEVPVTDSSSGADKVRLFKRLFRGRDDVYAVRWERLDGRVGYVPASRSRSEREQGIFIPLTDEVLRDHLDGRRTIGHDAGVLCAPTAFGKTVVAAWLIAERRVNTLVLVHRRQLLDQWRERLASFFGLPSTTIGQFGGGRKKPGGDIDIALMQSLGRHGNVDDLVAEYGQVIVDECHHIPAFTFERVLKAAKARFVLGLTATPVRKDGHHPIIIMQCGPVRFRVQPKDEAAARSFGQSFIPRPTTFQLPAGADAFSIQDIYSALAASEQRNDLIYTDLLDTVRQGHTPLLLTERKEHLEDFARRLEGRVQHVVVLHGGTGTRERKAVAERLHAVPAEEPCVVLATGRYAGEGFDYPRLDTLLMALPISWRGTLQQYVGRIQREHPGKQEVRIYDYVDQAVPVLVRMYEKRRKGYLNMGYRLQAEPAEKEDSGRPSQLSFSPFLE